MTERKLGLGGRMSGPRVIGSVSFRPLPLGERKHAYDRNAGDLCACPWCTATGASAAPHGPVWDTEATSLVTGEKWLVHFPELHGKPRLRAREGEDA